MDSASPNKAAAQCSDQIPAELKGEQAAETDFNKIELFTRLKV